jgi:hypothetical protein
MTLPDTVSKTRNMLLATCAGLALASFLTIRFAVFNGAPVDYWLQSVSVAALILTVISGIGGVIAHAIYLDTMRSN